MKHWRQIQKESFSNLEELICYLELSEDKLQLIDFSPRFPCLIPRRLAEKIPKNCLDHPMALQFLPLKQERIEHPLFVLDPLIEESSTRKTPALLHKYQGRVLIVTSGACTMHCRYCFRQNFSYCSSDKSFEKELSLIASDPTIHEVILSGGDPLSLSNAHLHHLLKQLDQIDHVQIIRFHTRTPIGIPERIDEEFLQILVSLNTQVTFVIHINSHYEYDPDVTRSLKSISALSIPILTQSVLLKGVNDSLNALKELCLASIARGFIPYYLHQLDKVRGAAHFETGDYEFLKKLRDHLPGYAVPTFVAEIPGHPSKTPLF